MIHKVALLIISTTAIVLCEPPSNDYGTPLGAPINSYGTQNHNTDDGHHEYGEPKSYEFGYQVKDDYSGNNYNRQESSDGNQVRGEYRVQLPDGRTQIVTYYADWQTGFHADVKYEGTAHYPDQYNTYQQQGGYGQGPANHYDDAGAHNNDYNGAGSNGYKGDSATSSVSIKDYSNGGTAFNTASNNGYNNDYNGNNNGYNNGNNNFNSYATVGFKPRPSNEYGAP